MSVGPRVVFTRFASSESVKLRGWRDHQARVAGVTAELSETESGPVLVWSLISANNRELARGGHLYGRFDDAIGGARRTIAVHSHCELKLISDRRLGGYGWFLESSDGPELTCSRWYETERDRRHAVVVALAALAKATLQPGARPISETLVRPWAAESPA
jgi:hypothetical protein